MPAEFWGKSDKLMLKFIRKNILGISTKPE